MSAYELFRYFVKDSFRSEITRLYVGMVKDKNPGLRRLFLRDRPLEVKRFKTYYDLFHFFRDHQSQPEAVSKFGFDYEYDFLLLTTSTTSCC